jgi:succinate dehydrogenase / fumarate reductase membrane anchor subunit
LSASEFRSPLSRARGLGSAHHGVSTFIFERATGVALVPLCLWAVYGAIKVAPLGYDNAVLLLRHPMNALFALLLMAASFAHMKAGMRVIIEDYIETPAPRIAALLASSAVCWLGWAVSTFAILWVAFGASLHH